MDDYGYWNFQVVYIYLVILVVVLFIRSVCSTFETFSTSKTKKSPQYLLNDWIKRNDIKILIESLQVISHEHPESVGKEEHTSTHQSYCIPLPFRDSSNPNTLPKEHFTIDSTVSFFTPSYRMTKSLIS